MLRRNGINREAMEWNEEKIIYLKIESEGWCSLPQFTTCERNGRIFKQSAKDWRRLILKKIERFCVELHGIG